MKDKITMLIRLQDCDNKIKEIVRKKMEGPLKIQRLQDELSAIEMKFQEESNKLESLKKDRRKFEQDVQEFDNKMEKSNIKLSNVKSNKEYTAALKEIDEYKRDKVRLEDEVIRLMEEIETMEKRCIQNKDDLLEMKKKFEQTKNDIETELQNLDEGLRQLETERDKFGKAMDRELLKRYLFLQERRGGQAISAVIGGVCQTCHMGIPPQKFNELIRGHLLLDCPHCHRMIYWGEDGDFKAVLNKG